MVVNDIFDEYSELLGVYALDAVDPDERDGIELHLASCPRCRAEVAEHRDVASFLSQAGAPAPEGIWDRIASELAPAAPPMRMAFMAPAAGAPEGPMAESSPEVASPPDGNVAPIGSARSAGRRPLLAILAVAACIIAVLGVVAVSQAQRLDRGQSVEEMANTAIPESKLKVDLAGDEGSARAVVRANGQGYLIMDGTNPPADGDVYQLWGKVDGTVLSLGTFGDATVVPFSVDPERIRDIELFAITEEKAPGVIASEQVPIMAGTV